MNVLYLADGYDGSKVHHNLVSALCQYFDNLSVTIFACLREKFTIEDSHLKFGDYNYSYIGKNVDVSYFWYKYDFFFKKRTKLRLLRESINIQEYDYILASTLYSEGIVAYELHKKYNIPYICFVRGTDVNLYAKKMFHLWPIGRKIIFSAQHIIFISASIRNNFVLTKSIKSIKQRVLDYSTILPNGIDDIWLNNIYQCRRGEARKIVYIGDFSENKNVISLIKAFDKLQYDFPNLELNLIGGGCPPRNRDLSSKIYEIIKNKSNVHFLGPIYDKLKLRNELRKNDIFAMVSHSETFGLVYIEALSQGLPIVYSQGQGVDGLFDNMNVCEKANADDVDSIYSALKMVVDNYSKYEFIGENINAFNWKYIVEKINMLLK